ncbi:hypothetical protein FRC06_001477 [Ceratobasidium sp. 370]|nr:hypothetical protein FRC06_001477 [Ceratobasidium sp. 370]
MVAFMVHGSTFQHNYVPQVYLHNHTNQCKVLYHLAGMRPTHPGLLATTAGFQPSSNEYMEALRKFVCTFNLPETILAFAAASETLEEWVRKGARATEVCNLAGLVNTSKVAFPVPALQSVMNRQELLELEMCLTKECLEETTMGEAGWGIKFSTILDMGHLESIQMSLIIFPSNKAGKDLSHRVWHQHARWVVFNHKFIEDVWQALTDQKSCEIIGANLDLQMDEVYEDQARAAQVSPMQQPVPCPTWAKILTSASHLPSGTVLVPQTQDIKAQIEFVTGLLQTGEMFTEEEVHEVKSELEQLDADFLKEWQFVKQDILQSMKVVLRTVKAGANIVTGLAEALAKSCMCVSMVTGAGGLLTQAVWILHSFGILKQALFKLTEENGEPVLTLAGWTYKAFDSEHEGEVGEQTPLWLKGLSVLPLTPDPWDTGPMYNAQ